MVNVRKRVNEKKEIDGKKKISGKKKTDRKKKADKVTMGNRLKWFCGLLCISLTGAVLLFEKPVMAKEQACEVMIPVAVEVEGERTNTGDSFEITITGETETVSMPEQTSQTVKGAGTVSFGPVSYTVPGDYHYRISQREGSDPEITYDPSVYDVTVRIVNQDGGGLSAEIWAVKDGGQDKTDGILFRNTKKAVPEGKKDLVAGGTKTQAPNTGDKTPVALWAGLFILAAFVVAGGFLLCICRCRTSYDRRIDDIEQEKAMRGND